VDLNVCLSANCDYNDGFNMKTDSGSSLGFVGGANGYADNFSGGTPGAHDAALSVDPMFVDPTRNTATFDSAFLLNTAPAWNLSSTYSVGDIVSSGDAFVYATSINPSGALINYRYVNKQGCSNTNPKPGVVPAVSLGNVSVTSHSPTVTWVSGPYFDPNWAGSTVELYFANGTPNYSTQDSFPDYVASVSCTPNCTTLTMTGGYAGTTSRSIGYIATRSQPCWELASLYRIRQAVANQTLYGGVDVITALINWIRAGFSPTNQTLKNAGSDGSDIGAVAVSAGSQPPPSSTQQYLKF
jgi:hypothetical protein